MEPDKLKLKNVTVKFVNRNDSKYGESFAVLVDEHIDGCACIHTQTFTHASKCILIFAI